MLKVVVLGDAAATLELAEVVRSAGHEVGVTANSRDDAIAALPGLSADLVITEAIGPSARLRLLVLHQGALRGIAAV